MKAVKYRVEPQKSVWGVSIRILDRDARMDTLMAVYTGTVLEDAVKSANLRLNKFGYELGEKVDGFDDDDPDW